MRMVSSRRLEASVYAGWRSVKRLNPARSPLSDQHLIALPAFRAKPRAMSGSGHFRRSKHVPSWSGATQQSEVRIKLRYFRQAPAADTRGISQADRVEILLGR